MIFEDDNYIGNNDANSNDSWHKVTTKTIRMMLMMLAILMIIVITV